jgi:hypothetical protein
MTEIIGLTIGFLLSLIIWWICIKIYRLISNVPDYSDVHQREREIERERSRIPPTYRSEVERQIIERLGEERENNRRNAIYGPDGVRTHFNGVNTQFRRAQANTDRQFEQFVNEQFEQFMRIPVRPKNGDIKKEYINRDRPDFGIRIFEFQNGRWVFKTTKFPREFLTEEDVVIK